MGLNNTHYEFGLNSNHLLEIIVQNNDRSFDKIKKCISQRYKLI